MIIFGTGFDVSHPPIASKIRCCDGQLLSEKWAVSPSGVPGHHRARCAQRVCAPRPEHFGVQLFPGAGAGGGQLDYAVDALTSRSASSMRRCRPGWRRRCSTTAGAVATTSTPAERILPRGRFRRARFAVGCPASISSTTTQCLLRTRPTFRQSPPPHNSAHGRPVVMRRCGVGGVVLVWVLGAGPSIGVGGTRGGRRCRCGCPTRRGG